MELEDDAPRWQEDLSGLRAVEPEKGVVAGFLKANSEQPSRLNRINLHVLPGSRETAGFGLLKLKGRSGVFP